MIVAAYECYLFANRSRSLFSLCRLVSTTARSRRSFLPNVPPVLIPPKDQGRNHRFSPGNVSKSEEVRYLANESMNGVAIRSFSMIGTLQRPPSLSFSIHPSISTHPSYPSSPASPSPSLQSSSLLPSSSPPSPSSLSPGSPSSSPLISILLPQSSH